MNEMLAAIEARRCEIDVPVWRLERGAGVGINHYRALRSGRYQGSAEIIRRLQVALAWLAAGQDEALTLAVEKNQAILRLAIALICEAQGLDGAVVQGMRPDARATASEEWLAAARVRNEAWALVNNVFGLRGAEIARAAGVSKAAVSVALRKVEERREDGDYDAGMVLLERAILGEW